MLSLIFKFLRPSSNSAMARSLASSIYLVRTVIWGNEPFCFASALISGFRFIGEASCDSCDSSLPTFGVWGEGSNSNPSLGWRGLEGSTPEKLISLSPTAIAVLVGRTDVDREVNSILSLESGLRCFFRFGFSLNISLPKLTMDLLVFCPIAADGDVGLSRDKGHYEY